MKNIKNQIAVLTLFISIFLIGCQSSGQINNKSYKYGEIVEINEKEILIYIGERNNVASGQELKAYKKEFIKRPIGFGGRHAFLNPAMTYSVEVGTIKIIEYKLDRFARAIIVKGAVSKDDEVDINRVWN